MALPKSLVTQHAPAPQPMQIVNADLASPTPHAGGQSIALGCRQSSSTKSSTPRYRETRPRSACTALALSTASNRSPMSSHSIHEDYQFRRG